MIITIDGLDGAGKSTLAKKLSNALEFEYVDKPIYELFNVKGDNNYLYNEIKLMQEKVYNETDSNFLKSYFTGLSLVYINECMKDKNIIIDRGLLSAYTFNGDEKSKPLFEFLIKQGIFFDLSIFLIASSDVRLSRMKKRNKNDPDMFIDKIKNLNHDSVISFINEHKELPCYFINTDNKCEEEVFCEALNIVKMNLINYQETIKKRKKN